jgi:hypothetical protein
VNIEHQPEPGGAWLSGPMIGEPSNVQWPADIPVKVEPADTRPEYNPAVLLENAVEALARVGIRVDLEHRRQVAVTAAADLLRALGVKPASAPRRDHAQ